jgi:glutathione S-transferase
MGCSSSKGGEGKAAPDAKESTDQTAKATAKVEPAPSPKPSGEVKVFGMPVSQNTMGPVMLAMDANKGGLEMCNIMEGEQMKPEFLAMNPYHHIPTMKDGSVAIGESNAILRYIALKYKPEYYPMDDPVTCGKIDFAMESFTTEVYEKGHYHTVYVTLGFQTAPADQEAANKKYSELLDIWLKHFLQGKFVNGDKLSIADFKVVPLLIAGLQPAVEKTIGLKLPERAQQYVDDFCAAVPSSAMLKSAGGYSIVEFLASKMPE